MMEGKINYDELSGSQRQIINNSDIHSNSSDTSSFSYHPQGMFIERTLFESELYNNVKCTKKAYYVFFFVIFGNCYFILKGMNLLKYIFAIMTYILLSILLFFPMVFLNILSLLLIIIVKGFKKFIVKFDDLLEMHIEDFIMIFINVLIGNFCVLIFYWKKKIDQTHINLCYKSYMKTLIYFPCVIMSIIIYFPQRLLINIAFIIIYYIFFKECSFFMLTTHLSIFYKETFNSNF